MSLLLPPDKPNRAEQSATWARVLVQVERVLTIFALLSTLVLVLTQVTSRYVFNSPISWTEEVARYSLVWLTFLGAGFVMARGGHITVDLVVNLLGSKMRKVVNAIAITLTLLTALALTWAGFELSVSTSSLSSPSAGIPMPVLYMALCVGYGLILLHGVHNLMLGLKGKGELSAGSSEIDAGEARA